MWRLSLPVLALLLLAAHFWRAGAWPLVLICMALLPLLAWHRRWVAHAVQATLVLGTLEWLRTAALLAQQRLALGQPVVRMVLILAAVALFTAAAAAVFGSAALRCRYAAPRAPGAT